MNQHFVGTVILLLGLVALVVLTRKVFHLTNGYERELLIALLEREGFQKPVFAYVDTTERFCALAEARVDDMVFRLNISPHPDGDSVRIMICDCLGRNRSERIVAV